MGNDLKFRRYFKKSWIFLVLGLIITLFLFYNQLAILLTFFILIGLLISYIPSFSFKSRFIRSLNKFSTIEDKAISQKLMISIEEVEDIMHKLSMKQDKIKWLIVYLNNRYIFYNEKTIKKFKIFYNQGYNDKKIFEFLRKEINIRTRAEIKAIEHNLIIHDRLKEREFTIRKGIMIK